MIAIIAAMPQEFNDLEASLTDKKVYYAGQLKFVSGKIANRAVVLVLSGIGKVNAAAATAIVIEKYQVAAVINTGSAGGLKRGMNIGDIVIGTRVAHHDVDVTAFNYEVGQVPQLPRYYESDQKLIDAARQVMDAFPSAHVFSGLIVSGDQFITDPKKVAALKAQFDEPMACEMEAAAIAQTCHILAVPFLIIRALSDNADENAESNFDEFIVQAGRQSAIMVQNLLTKLDS